MRHFCSLATALAVALALTSTAGATAASATTPQTANTLGTDQITNGTTTAPVGGSDGWCMDDKGGSNTSGTVIELYQCNQNWNSQLWTVEADGTIRVQNHCIDVQGGSTSAGAAVLLDTCNGSGSPGEQWQEQSNGSLLNVHSGKCLGVDGGDPVYNDQPLFIWPCDGNDTQVWHVPSAQTRAATAATRMQDMFNTTEDLFDTSGACTAPKGNCWWWSANEEDALVNFSLNEKIAYGTASFPGGAQYRADLAATFAKYDPSPCVGNGTGNCTGDFTEDAYNDDAGWWGLTWLNAYRLTGITNYLNLAENIFGYIHTNGWDNVCDGGVWQFNKSGAQKDAVASEVYFELAAQLYRATDTSSYETYAIAAWNWLKSSVVVEVPENGHTTVATSADLANPNARLLVADGTQSQKGTTTTTSLCPPESGTTKWTYNQGVILGALDDMYQITSSSAYLDPAEAIANTVEADKQSVAGQPAGPYSNPALLDSGGELSEPCAASPSTSWPDGCAVTGSTDSWLQFKGIFLRNLWCLSQSAAGSPSYTAFISANSAKIYYDDQDSTANFAAGTADLNEFGFLWDNNGGSWPGSETKVLNEATQGSALDGLAANMGDTYGMC